MYEHTQQVKTFFPETIFAVLVAQTVFNIPFCLLRTRTHELSDSTIKKIPLFIILIAIGVWISRTLLVLTGSYFHYIPGLNFVNTSVLYSPLAIISTLGRIVLIFLCIKMFRKVKCRGTIFISIYVLIEICWHLLSAKRMELFIALLCIIFAYIYVKKKIPLTAVACFILILFIGSPLIVYYRFAVQESSKDNNSFVSAPITAIKKIADSDMKISFHMLIDRLNDGQYTAGCIKTVPEKIPFWQGKTYKRILWIPVPRVLYHQRPAFQLNYLIMILGLPPTATSAPVTMVGEAYINYGWLGIPVVFLILGTIYKAFEYIFGTNLSSSQAAIFLFFYIMMIRMTADPAVTQLSWMLKIIILLCVCKFFESGLLFRKKHNSEL
jgi:hypothetical protein